MADELRPVSLKREGDGLKIEWSDGTTTTVKGASCVPTARVPRAWTSAPSPRTRSAS